ncbi:hypothetical protein Tco_0241079 [Tanacetum coccineum]
MSTRMYPQGLPAIASAAHFSHSEKPILLGDDDALLFVARSLPTPVSWLGSHTKNVNAAGTGSGSATVFTLILYTWILSRFAATWMDKFDVEDMDIYYSMPQRMLADCKFLTNCAPRGK